MCSGETSEDEKAMMHRINPVREAVLRRSCCCVSVEESGIIVGKEPPDGDIAPNFMPFTGLAYAQSLVVEITQ